MENFPWNRLTGVEMPASQKPMVDVNALNMSGPAAVRELLGDGNYGGHYARSDAEMLAIWSVAVAETQSLLRNWAI